MTLLDISILPFLAVAIMVIVTPGPDTALTVRNTMMGGRIAGASTAIGVACGQLVWALATSLGLVAILAASTFLFAALKYAGALYLCYLGAQALRHALRRSAAMSGSDAGPPRRSVSPAAAYGQGLLSNLGNPKMLAFFASLLPQFAPPSSEPFLSHMLLGTLFASMTALWLVTCATLLAGIGAAVRAPLLARIVEGLLGICLIGFAVRMATR